MKALSGISPIVYHATDLSALEKILSEDRFKLSASVGTSSERKHQSKKFYYLSTTRHKLGGFHLEQGSYTAVLVLDGTKLGHNYIGDPIDYWGEGFRRERPEKYEAEDRIWSEKPFIEPASKYIKEIHILWDEKWDHNNHVKASLRKTLIDAKKMEIPTWMYANKRPFLLMDKRRSLDLKDIDLTTKPPGKSYQPGKKEWYKPYLELYYETRKEKLSEKARKFLNGILGWWKDDGVRSLEVDIHNNKTKDAYKVVELFKKEGLSSPEEFVNFLIDKWKSILGRD